MMIPLIRASRIDVCTVSDISGCANALLNLFFVIVCHLSVAGVGIGTVISQLISCILVLRCLYQTEGSYQLRFSKLSIKGEYLKQIFRWDCLPGSRVQ